MIAKLGLGLALLCAAFVAQAAIIETFDTGSGNWNVVNYPFHAHVGNPAMFPAAFDAGFGNPAGSIRIGDSYAETGVAAPAPYLGDKSACYGHTLSYDIYLRYVDVGATYPAVVLNAGTLSIYFDAPAPQVGVWETRVVLLTEEGWRRSGTGALVDEATFRSVLANLVGLYIYTEWHTGADDTNFDNVYLNGVSVGVGDGLTLSVALSPCYPNPFNPATSIRFSLAAAGPVRLQVLGADGRQVRTLIRAWREAGEHVATWDGCDEASHRVASGLYFCRLEAASARLERKMLLMK